MSALLNWSTYWLITMKYVALLQYLDFFINIALVPHPVSLC